MSIAQLQKEIMADSPSESTMTDGVSTTSLRLTTFLSYRPQSWQSSMTEVSFSVLMPAQPT